MKSDPRIAEGSAATAHYYQGHPSYSHHPQELEMLGSPVQHEEAVTWVIIRESDVLGTLGVKGPQPQEASVALGD